MSGHTRFRVFVELEGDLLLVGTTDDPTEAVTLAATEGGDVMGGRPEGFRLLWDARAGFVHPQAPADLRAAIRQAPPVSRRNGASR